MPCCWSSKIKSIIHKVMKWKSLFSDQMKMVRAGFKTFISAVTRCHGYWIHPEKKTAQKWVNRSCSSFSSSGFSHFTDSHINNWRCQSLWEPHQNSSEPGRHNRTSSSTVWHHNQLSLKICWYWEWSIKKQEMIDQDARNDQSRRWKWSIRRWKWLIKKVQMIDQTWEDEDKYQQIVHEDQ